MSIFEYDEKLHEKFVREEGREEGYIYGKLYNLVELVCRKLVKINPLRSLPKKQKKV